MSEKTYYQRNRDVILNRAKDYYENDKERLRGRLRNLENINININIETYLKKKKQKEGIWKKQIP